MKQRGYLFWLLNSSVVSVGDEMSENWNPTVPLPFSSFPWENGNIFKWLKISRQRCSPPAEQIYCRVVGISTCSAFVSVSFICFLRSLYIYRHNLNLRRTKTIFFNLEIFQKTFAFCLFLNVVQYKSMVISNSSGRTEYSASSNGSCAHVRHFNIQHFI